MSNDKPRTRLCWLCGRPFRGNHFAEKEIDGHLRELHKECAEKPELMEERKGISRSQTIYDPPSGWCHGFPKPYQPLPNESINETLLRDGYPQWEIDVWEGSDVPCRFWRNKWLETK